MILSSFSYEPDEPESSSARTAYLTAKDIRLLALVMLILLILMTPLYLFWRRQTEKHLCKENFRAMFTAMGSYLEANDGRYPPAYVVGQGESPRIDRSGLANTWATQLSQYMPKRATFRCPSAIAKECARVEALGEDPAMCLTYGLFIALAGIPASNIMNDHGTILIGETSNGGSQGTYDPLPLLGADNRALDGFLIGYDTGNLKFSRGTRAVTRLAFYDAGNGQFRSKGRSRHEGGIHFLFCDGHVATMTPEAALVRHRYPELEGFWASQ